MRKSLLYAALAVVAVTGVLLYIRSQRIIRNEAYFEAVSKYVYAFTSGSINRDEAIRVRFVSAAVGKEQVGQKVSGTVFSISPAIEGQAVWEDDRTIKLKPTTPLPSGKKYKGTVYLRRIYSEAPSIARVFDFDFSVRETAFEVIADGVRSDPFDPHQQQITGRIHINEPAEGAKVEKMLQAKQGAKALTVSWTHSNDGQTHEFTVKGVERSNVRSKVRLAWSGEAIGVHKDGQTEQDIPSVDEFVVLSVRAVQVDEQYVLINFSDPVAPGQELAGLIRVEGFSGKLRFVADRNFVRVYPDSRITGEHKVVVDAGIRNAAGKSIGGRSEWTINFEDLKPAVRLVGRGAIIPQDSKGGVIFPFEAVGLTAVDVEIFKIYNSNILQYLQVNDLEGEQELERVGKIILQKKVSLRELDPNANTRNWQRYALDLKEMIKQDPGAIYQVRLAFRRGYTDLACAAKDGDDDLSHIGKRNDDGNLVSIFGSYRGVYWSNNDSWYGGGEEEGGGEGEGEGETTSTGYSWERRTNACAKEYYYSEHFAKRNVFVSDLGLTAKRGRDGSLFMAVTDLHTAQPVNGIELELYNYQLQSITKTRTDATGTVMVEGLRETPFVAVATGNNRRGYLRMADGGTLSLSRFDVAGVEAQKGLKGYLYGERGVWRPGDSLFLHFVLEDKIGNLPAGHPLTFELTDPRGALQYRTVQTKNVGGVYPLHCATRQDAPTGNWTAKVQIGGATFTKALKIETVKPNRLKMDLNFGKKEIASTDENLAGKLSVLWLHGAVAKNLKAKVDMQIRAAKTEFKTFKDFTFDDPARSFYSDPQTLLDAEIDENGQASVPVALGENNQAPGKLIANFKVRVFEKSGDYSTDNFSMDYYPYQRFVGVAIPRGQWGDKTVDQRGGTVRFACVDKNGKAQPNQKLSLSLFRCDWRWWWDEDATSNVAQFNAAENVNAIDNTTVTTDANGMATWKVKPDGWGRYFVRAIDPEGGHASGDFFWSGYPEDLNDMKSRNAAAMLPFTVAKDKYAVGDEVTLKVPASEAGRILLTLENGTRVVQHMWFDAKAGDNLLKFKAIEAMAPTIYAHVSLMQPHAQTKNDLPIRMYGVMPVNIENPQTHLAPTIEMQDVLKPDEAFTVNVRESHGKACTYTLDIVDDGLLDLTRFKTPDPWEAFFAREALGVKTWDIYDYVLGAYGAELERILSIGGDGINQKSKNAAQVNRFKPTVLHVGPFRLEKGQTAKHTLKIDHYVGSVRVMVVCSAPASGGNGAYGSAEKTCPVRKPLMILPTLPRVLAPGETLKLPVDVFAMEAKVKSASIQVREKSGIVSVSGSSTNTLNFSQPGEAMTYFDLKVGNKTGVARFTITAQGGGETATQEIELLVRNPNPATTTVWEGVVEAGQEWKGSFDPSKYTDISNAVLEVSPLPSFNLSRHLEYLIQYPHGCIEQTTSAAFPQLYVDLLTPLTQKQKDDITRNVTAAISKMRNFQASSGGFSYWPGENYINSWASNYAGHFLLEAKNKGYTIPDGMLDRWIAFQVQSSRQWSSGTTKDYYDNDLTQAYRLYTLALAGKPDMAGMNRMMEKKDKYSQTAYMLASAYAQAGKPEAARDLLNGKWREDWKYSWCGYTYGSDLRDRSLLLETYVASGDIKRAEAMADFITKEMGANEPGWYWNTQSLATGLRAISKYLAKTTGGGPVFTYQFGSGAAKTGDNSRPIASVNFTENAWGSSNVAVKNTGKVKLYARLVVSGQSVIGTEAAHANNLAISVKYLNTKGEAIDVAKVKQGTDFVAEVTVSRTGNWQFEYRDMALTQIFPSGWEITNSRMNNIGGAASSPMDYQDVRDDRVLTYFGLTYGSTRIYRIQLNAAYAGHYYLPAVNAGSMYDNRIGANSTGLWVDVM
jgi:hypothetical protein